MANMELVGIIEKFAESGWDLIDGPAKAWLATVDEKGFLARVADTKDRRMLRIFLTAKAKVLSDQYNKVSEEMSRIFYKDFSDEEIVAFERTLEKVLNNLIQKEEEI